MHIQNTYFNLSNIFKVYGNMVPYWFFFLGQIAFHSFIMIYHLLVQNDTRISKYSAFIINTHFGGRGNWLAQCAVLHTHTHTFWVFAFARRRLSDWLVDRNERVWCAHPIARLNDGICLLAGSDTVCFLFIFGFVVAACKVYGQNIWLNSREHWHCLLKVFVGNINFQFYIFEYALHRH